MKKLYGLYEIYDVIKTSEGEALMSCIYAKRCVDEYNKIISNCLIRDNNDNFREALDNLNSLFKGDEWISKNKCNETILNLLSTQEAHDLQSHS